MSDIQDTKRHLVSVCGDHTAELTRLRAELVERQHDVDDLSALVRPLNEVAERLRAELAAVKKERDRLIQIERDNSIMLHAVGVPGVIPCASVADGIRNLGIAYDKISGELAAMRTLEGRRYER